MANTQSHPPLAVLAPDLIGRAFSHPPCAEVLQCWREGRLCPVLNRALLVRYLKLLRELGLPERLVRRWGWWFTARDKTLFMPESNRSGISAAELCQDLARSSGANIIVGGSSRPLTPSSGPDTGERLEWMSAEEFLRSQH